MGFQVAIDGPAGAGKSSISRQVAQRLSFIYVDTGAMYRTIALYLSRLGVDPSDTKGIEDHCQEAKVSIEYRDGEQVVLLGEEDVRGLIRSPEVSKMASAVSAVQKVRDCLTELQRSLARQSDVVMDGRDIGTTILPEAQVKIFLTASPEVRAKRRLLQAQEMGQTLDFDQVLKEIKERDERDMNRAASPLRQAEDAILVDSSDMTMEEVTCRIISIVEERR